MTLGSPIPVSISARGTIGNCAKPWTPYSPGWALRNAKPSLCDVKVAAGCFYLRCIAGPYRMQVGSLISVGCPRFRKTTCDPAKYRVPAVSSAAPATSVAITVSAKIETPTWRG